MGLASKPCTSYFVMQLEADVVLVSVGRRPYTEGLNLEAAGVQLDNKGRIVIDDQFATSAKHIRCIGDVTFGPMLAHKAEEEGLSTILCKSPMLTMIPSRHCYRRTHQTWTRTCQLQCHPFRCLYTPRGRLGRQDRARPEGCRCSIQRRKIPVRCKLESEDQLRH